MLYFDSRQIGNIFDKRLKWFLFQKALFSLLSSIYLTEGVRSPREAEFVSVQSTSAEGKIDKGSAPPI